VFCFFKKKQAFFKLDDALAPLH